MSKEINNLKVTKASGSIEPFLIDKLKNSLERANATTDEINTIVETILPKLYNGISTQKIYTEAFRLLRKRSKNNAGRFHLKKGIMELGPSGFRTVRRGLGLKDISTRYRPWRATAPTTAPKPR